MRPTTPRPLTLEEADQVYRQQLEFLREHDDEPEELDRVLDELFASCVTALDRVA